MKFKENNDMFWAVKRGAPRIAVMAGMGFCFFLLARFEPHALGPVMAPSFLALGVTFMSLAISDLALRVLQPGVDGQNAAKEALNNKNTAAGLVYLGRSLLAAVVMLMVVSASRV